MEKQRTLLKRVLRILGSFVLLYIAVLVVNLILGVGPNMLMKAMGTSPNMQTYLGSSLTYGFRLTTYVILPALALQKVCGINPWPNFFPTIQKSWKDVFFGFLLVSGILTLFFLIETRLGWLALDSWNWQKMSTEEWLRIAWTGLLVNLCVAVGEETIFRGYLLTSLKMAVGRGWAILVMMIVFGLFHIIAYIESGLQSSTLVLALLLATLFGGLFGLVYLRTGSLWLPVILHFSWNFVENDVLNLTGELDNVNLIGALTRLQAPLTITELTLGNVVLVETLAFALIALGLWLWLRRKGIYRRGEPLSPKNQTF